MIPFKLQARLTNPSEVLKPARRLGCIFDCKGAARIAWLKMRRTHSAHICHRSGAPAANFAHRSECQPAERYRLTSLDTMPCCNTKKTQGLLSRHGSVTHFETSATCTLRPAGCVARDSKATILVRGMHKAQAAHRAPSPRGPAPRFHPATAWSRRLR